MKTSSRSSGAGRRLLLACAAALSVCLAAPAAEAAFTCGPGWVPYRAFAGGGFIGVRCVKYITDGNGLFAYAWYGEGTRGKRYRHVGYTRWGGGMFKGSQADVRDGADDHDGVFDGTVRTNCSAASCGGYLGSRARTS